MYDLRESVNDEALSWERYIKECFEDPMEMEPYDFSAFAWLGYWYDMQELIKELKC